MANVEGILTKKQQDLITDNKRLMNHFMYKKDRVRFIPPHLRDSFYSTLGWQFCLSALKYDEELGFKFSTYAYGGFNFCWKKILSWDNENYKKNNYHSNDRILSMEENSELSRSKERGVRNEFLYSFLDKVKLTPRERMVIEDYYFGKTSLKDIGEYYGVSRSRMSQVLQRVIEKLKNAVETQQLDVGDFYGRGT